MTLSILGLGVAALFLGPSKLFGFEEKLIFVQIGLFCLGAGQGPIAVKCLPNVFLNTQLKYKIVEKTDERLDNALAVQQSCLYRLVGSAFGMVAPFVGAQLYKHVGYRTACDVLFFF